MRSSFQAAIAAAAVLVSGLLIASQASARDGQLSLLNDQEAELLDGRHAAHHDKPSEQWKIPQLTNASPLSVATLKTDNTTSSALTAAGTSVEKTANAPLKPRTQRKRSFKSKTAAAKSRSWIDRFLHGN